MTAEYPYPDCCEHTFNTHTDDHCLACNCRRPAVQIAPAPEGDTGIDLRECGVCHALTTDEARVRHLDYHERQMNTLENTLTSLTNLARTRRHRKDTP
jgi:hypothetical protein